MDEFHFVNINEGLDCLEQTENKKQTVPILSRDWMLNTTGLTVTHTVFKKCHPWMHAAVE